MRFSYLSAGLFCVFTAVSAPVSAAAPASAAQCFVVKFLDQSGGIVPANPPMIGMMIGDKFVIEGVAPAHASRAPGAEAACPPELMKQVQDLFNASCLSNASRAQAAAENSVDVKIINDGCAGMSKALSKPK